MEISGRSKDLRYDEGMKFMIYLGITVGGLIGGWLGSLLDHHNMLGLWSILLGGVGGVVGLWAAYKLSQNY